MQHTEIRMVAMSQRAFDMIRYSSTGLWQVVLGKCGFLRGRLDRYLLSPAIFLRPGRAKVMAGAHESAPLPHELERELQSKLDLPRVLEGEPR